MVTPLAPDVFWIDLSGTNAYLVRDGDALTLVDAGMPWHAGPLRRAIQRVTHDVASIDRVLVTHADLDHVGGLDRLPGLEATIYASPTTRAFLTKERRPPLHSHRGVLQRGMDLLRRPLSLPIEALDDGDRVGSFTAYHTPGHTQGHTAFVSEARSVGFLGDLVRSVNGGFRRSGWLLSHDRAAVRESLGRLLEQAPPFAVACPGHGTPVTEDGFAAVRAAAEWAGEADD